MNPRPILGGRSPHRLIGAVALALAAGLVASCHKSTAAASAKHQPMSVTVARLEMRPLQDGLAASGLLVPRLEAAVSTELNGYRVAQVLVDQDAAVAEGQPLARLDDTLLRAQIAQQRAVVDQQKVAAERMQAEAQRVAGLDNQGVLPQEQIVERRLSARSGAAAVVAAQAQLDDLTTREAMMTVRAPVAGLVLERTVRPGDVATPAMVMFRIAKGDQIELNAEVPEADLSGIRAGDAAEVTLPDGRKVSGRVRLVSPEVDQQTKLGHVRISLPVRADLRPGGFARAAFLNGARSAVVAPDSAVRFDADGAYVMIVSAKNIATRTPVRTGGRTGGMVELIDGPAAGSRVLLGGGAFILDGDPVNPVEGPETGPDAGAGSASGRP